MEEKQFSGVRAFTMLPVGISRDKDLLKMPKSILLMGEIISMLNITGKFFMSNREIAKRLACTTRMVSNYLDLLESKKLIKRNIVYADSQKKIIKGRYITAGDDLVKYISLGWGNTFHEGTETDFNTLVKPISHKYNNIKEQYNRSINAAPYSEELIDQFASATLTVFEDKDRSRIAYLINQLPEKEAKEVVNTACNQVIKGDGVSYLARCLINKKKEMNN